MFKFKFINNLGSILLYQVNMHQNWSKYNFEFYSIKFYLIKNSNEHPGNLKLDFYQQI